jgi:hypothetical protein
MAAMLAATILSTPSAQAFEDPAHTFTCLGLMLSDPATHALECLPNRVVTAPDKYDTGGVVIIVTPPPPPPPPPPPGPCPCGPCYLA